MTEMTSFFSVSRYIKYSPVKLHDILSSVTIY